MIAQFKKDYFSYLLGILVPAAINFLTIPLFKSFLGTGDFGTYSFYFSILLIINSSLSGGIVQSIVRLHVEFVDNKMFFKQCIILILLLQFFLIIPVFFYIKANNSDEWFCYFFIIALSLSNLYITLIGITQANLLSGVSASSETFRTILFLGITIILLRYVKGIYFLNSIFVSLIISYSFSTVFLLVKNGIVLPELKSTFNITSLKVSAVAILRYGGFLVPWYFFSYGVSLGNRFILAHFIGKQYIGNFTATFDLINKSIVLLLSPVLTSLFPLIVKAFAEDEFEKANKLIRKIILIEVGLMILTIACFAVFGFSILSYVIKTPRTTEYFFIGLQIIVGTFIWQIGMLQHKYLEVKKKTQIMLLCIIISFFGSFLIDFFLISLFGLSFAPTGFLFAGVLYLVAITFHTNRTAYVPSLISNK